MISRDDGFNLQEFFFSDRWRHSGTTDLRPDPQGVGEAVCPSSLVGGRDDLL
jgi:hypothetical protein